MATSSVNQQPLNRPVEAPVDVRTDVVPLVFLLLLHALFAPPVVPVWAVYVNVASDQPADVGSST